MSKELTDPKEIFKSDNIDLAHNLKSLVHKTVSKANQIVNDTEDMEDLSKAMKIAEIAGKISGIVEEKNQINMQINQISGFTFIEIGSENTIQELEVNEQKTIN